MHNANTQNDPLTTFPELTNLLVNFDQTKNKPIIFVEDFNLFLDRSLDTKTGFSGIIKRRLDYIFISQNLQERAKHTEILNAIRTYYSPVLYSLQNLNQCQRGQGIWTFNNSVISNEVYVLRLKELINKIKGELNRRNQFFDQVKWEVLKYEIRCFTIMFSKGLAKTKKVNNILWETS